MKLVTGNIVNTERKFIVHPHPGNYWPYRDWIHRLGNAMEDYWIDQFYVGNTKYRRITVEETSDSFFDDGETETKVVGYTKNVKDGNVTNVTEISEQEYNEAYEKAERIASRKNRMSYKTVIHGKEFHVDVDDYTTTGETIIEVSGDHLEEFTPPEIFDEVTNDQRYSAKEIYKHLVEFAKQFR